MTTSDDVDAKKQLRRRIATAVLIAGLLGALFFATRNRPTELEVRYYFSQLPRAALRSLDVVWHKDGNETMRSTFNYAGRAAPPQQTQAVSLPPGIYQVEAILRFSDRPRSTSRTEVELDRQEVLEIPLGE